MGTHYDVGVDLGNIRDRGFTFDYVSSPYRCEGGRPAKIHWAADTPGRTSVKFQLRSAATQAGLSAAAWRGPSGPDSYYRKPGSRIRKLTEGKWIQYRAVFDTFNGAASPVLDGVEIDFK